MICLGGKCDFCRFLGQNRAPLIRSDRDMAAGVRAVCSKSTLFRYSFHTYAGALSAQSVHEVMYFNSQNQEYPENRPNPYNVL
jgi:hypothetical protein